jgi:hypothetical protein
MSFLVEGEWTRPYEQFGQDTIEFNLAQADLIKERFGKPVPEHRLREGFLAQLESDEEWIEFDHPYVDPNDSSRTPSGLLIHYPVRTPTLGDIEERKIGPERLRMAHAVIGFGSLEVLLFPETLLTERFGTAVVHPFRLDLRIRGQNFSSYPELTEDIDEGGYFASYNSWISKVSRQTGKVYLPIELPVLTDIEFRRTRINPKRSFRTIIPSDMGG